MSSIYHVIAGLCAVLPDKTKHVGTAIVRFTDGWVTEISEKMLIEKNIKEGE